MQLEDIHAALLLKMHRVIVDGEVDSSIVSSGIRQLDSMLAGGFEAGSLYVIGARPSMGKSLFLSNLTYLNLTKKILFLSLEMSKEAIYKQLVSIDLGVDTNKITNGLVTPDNFHRFATKTHDLAQKAANIHILDSSEVMPDTKSCMDVIKHYKAKYGIELVIVDHLHQLMDTSFKDGNMMYTYIIRQLKESAKLNNVPVVIAAQLSRAVDARTNNKPVLSDLRDSGTIEQVADCVIMLYREGYYNKSTAKQILELLVVKNREGQTGNIKLNVDLASKRIT